MKIIVFILLLLAGISNVWGQLPTPTPKPILILRSINLNDPTLTPPLKLFVLGPIGVGEYGGNFDFEILDDHSKMKTIYGASLIDRLWIGDFGSEQSLKKGYIFFEEFKVFKKIDSTSCLVKIQNPHFTTTGIGENNSAFMNIYGHHSKIYYLTSSDGSTKFDDLKEDESVNAIVKMDGYFTQVENGESKNFIKLNVVSSEEPNVLALAPTPTPLTPDWYPIDDLLIAENSDIQANSGIHIQIDKLIGKLINGSFQIIASAKGSGFIVETAVSEFGGNNRTYYLRVPKHWKRLVPGGYADTTGTPNFGPHGTWMLGVFPTKEFFTYKNDFGGRVRLRVLDLKLMAYPSPQ
jgi:hypothetical protein